MKNPVAPRNFGLILFIKTAAAILLILITTGLLYGSFKVFTKEDDRRSMTYYVNNCDRDYYEKDYVRLYNTLALHDLYTEDYDKYWEVVNAYSVYTTALEWRIAAENGREGADEKMAQAIEELSEVEGNVKYPANLPVISGFIQEFDSK